MFHGEPITCERLYNLLKELILFVFYLVYIENIFKAQVPTHVNLSSLYKCPSLRLLS
jgi:hypothetical protein